MPGKVLKTRIQNKIDSLANFQLNNPYILSGEIITAFQTLEVEKENGETEQKKVGLLYVGPGYFNDLVPIVGPASDVKLWAKVDNFVDVVIEKYVDKGLTGDIQNQDTVNDMISKINNNFTELKQSITDIEIPSKTSQLTNDGEGETVPIKDFISGYSGYEFVSRDSVKQYIDNLNLEGIDQLRKELESLKTEIEKQIKLINDKFDNYYTSSQIDEILKDYLKQIQIGDKDGGVILSSSSTLITSSQLWNQIKDTSKSDIEQIADAAASTALEQAKDYTDNKLSEFITISYKGPYNSYEELIQANPEGKAGIIYLVSHNHSDENDIFDEYIWVQTDEGSGNFEKVGNTDVKLTDYLQAIIKEDNTGVIPGDEKSVSKVEIVEDPIGSGNKVFKVTYKTLIKQESFTPGKVAIGFQNGALLSTSLVSLPLLGIAASSTSSIGETTTLGQAIRTLEGKIVEAGNSGVKKVDIATNGGLEVSGGPITNAGTLVVTHLDRPTEPSSVSETLGSQGDTRSYIKNIGVDKFGHIVSVTSGEESVVDSYATSANFTTTKNSINLQIQGVGNNFKTFNASLNSIPALALTQTDDDDDFLVFYCGDSISLTSSVAVSI